MSDPTTDTPRSLPGRRRYGSYVDTSTTKLFLSNHSFDSLQTEQAYLLAMLQCQSAQASDVARQYSDASSLLPNASDGKSRRRLRKRLSLLRTTINNASRQEKALLLRLGQISAELQMRRGLCGLAIMEMVTSYEYDSRMAAAAAAAAVAATTDAWHIHCPEGTPSSEWPSSSSLHTASSSSSDRSGVASVLNGASPEFVPGVCAMQMHEVHGEESELHHHGLEYEYECMPSVTYESESKPESQSLSQSHRRRLSLPNLHSLWP